MTRVVPLVVYTVFIFVMGSLPTKGGKGGISDKVLHAVAFGVLVPLSFTAIGYFAAQRAWLRRLAFAVLYSAALGGLLELWQGLLAYRSQELLDFVADVVGALLGALVVAAYVKLTGSQDLEAS